MRVAIVALGPSSYDYVRFAEAIGNRGQLFDEVWCINGYGHVLQCDRIFHMDDVRIQQIRADGGNKKISAMLDWMKKHPGPIYTSRTHPDYPGLVEYPIENVLNSIGKPYINNTAAAAICFAIHMKVKELTLFGVDFTYPDMRAAEKGRACCEYWLGFAFARGTKIIIPAASSLCDACVPASIYGYDTRNIKVNRDEKGKFALTFEDKPEADWPTAAQVEAAYNYALDENGKLKVKHAGANGKGSQDQREDHTGERDGGGTGPDPDLAPQPADPDVEESQAEAA